MGDIKLEIDNSVVMKTKERIQLAKWAEGLKNLMTQLISTDCSGKKSINVVVNMKPDANDESYEIDTSKDGSVTMHVSQTSLSYGFATLG